MEQRPSCEANSVLCSPAIPCIPWNLYVQHRVQSSLATCTIQPNVLLRTRCSRKLCYVDNTAERLATYRIQPNVLHRTRYSRTSCYIHDTAERFVRYTIQPHVLHRTRYSRRSCYIHDTAEGLATHTIQPNVSPHAVSFSKMNCRTRTQSSCCSKNCLPPAVQQMFFWCPRISLRPIKDTLSTSATHTDSHVTLTSTQQYLDLSCRLILTYTL